jgi:hypothetical protein
VNYFYARAVNPKTFNTCSHVLPGICNQPTVIEPTLC